jgi:hypothetical protein
MRIVVDVDRSEIDRRWMAREPVEGVAFLLNDSVRVTAGPHAGTEGRVVSLLMTTPSPVYLVGLGDGRDAKIQQSDLVTATAGDPGAALSRLQRWYSAQCDGDWEHGLGVRIESLDNPGWMVSIHLAGTPLETTEFPEVRKIEDEREWVDCRVVGGEFHGAGGPHMLGAIIEIFVQWAEDAGQRTA